jgi:5-formyltetrahydrofolate cyclo-ligase
MTDATHPYTDEKSRLRDLVSAKLLEIPAGSRRPVALPDAIFHHELDHFITDFQGSREATLRLVEQPEWQQARIVFITPDNSTAYLRELAIRQAKTIIMTTYGIRRGSVLLTRAMVPDGQEEYASTLVGMERFGQSLMTIEDLEAAGSPDVMVTGALAVSRAHGGRAGKGAGWFDAEWGIWGALNLTSPETPVFGIVHDLQVVAEAFPLDPWDCHLNIITTPSETIRVPRLAQPHGILWDKFNSPAQRAWAAAIPYVCQLHVREFGKEFVLSV